MPAARTAVSRVPPWGLAAALALLWLAAGPPTPDLAAQAYRAALFARHGFEVWNPFWFAGHHLPGYSLLFPPLGALLGARVVGVMCAVCSTLLFARLAHRAFGPRARLGTLWFAAASVADLCIGRITFTLGVTLGLAALAALQSGRPRGAAGLALLCAAGSPVAGAFLALAGTAVALGRGVAWTGRRPRRRDDPLVPGALGVAGAALAGAAGLALAFPEGGTLTLPFLPTVAAVGFSLAVLLLLPREQRVLRTGAALYVLVVLALVVVATPMGSNVVRLGATFAGPVLVCAVGGMARSPRRRAVLLAVAAGLLAWQWHAPVREIAKGAGDPSTQAAYYEGVVGFLRGQAGPGGVPGRVEVPFTQGHWEAAHLARHVPLARGWATQLDRRHNALFFAPTLDPAAYERWLRRSAVRFVAVPDVPLDPAGRQEAALVRGGLSFLRPVWRDAHWQVFAVRDPLPLVSGAGTLEAFTQRGFTVRARRPGWILVRTHHTPYWRTSGAPACVSEAPGGWTRVFALAPGRITVRARFAPGRLASAGPVCERSAAGSPA
jgi:hypothetical protein